jgi:hypothetical protein
MRKSNAEAMGNFKAQSQLLQNKLEKSKKETILEFHEDYKHTYLAPVKDKKDFDVQCDILEKPPDFKTFCAEKLEKKNKRKPKNVRLINIRNLI